MAYSDLHLQVFDKGDKVGGGVVDFPDPATSRPLLSDHSHVTVTTDAVLLILRIDRLDNESAKRNRIESIPGASQLRDALASLKELKDFDEERLIATATVSIASSKELKDFKRELVTGFKPRAKKLKTN